MIYNWQQDDWPHFRYDLTAIEDLLFAFSEKIGRAGGMLATLSESAQSEAVIEMMVSEAIKTSEIEGEYLRRQDVMSSIKNNLGLNQVFERVEDQRAEGIAEMMIAVRNEYPKALSRRMLFDWHKMLMKGNARVRAGAWRKHKEPMQVVSGAIGREKVHFEAPPSEQIPAEMKRFVQWFNATKPGRSQEIKRAPVRSAIAHLYFETIHPFEDGNGRIGRAISEKVLSQGSSRPVLLSLSATIEEKKSDYYNALKEGQRSNEITAWLHYFVSMVLEAQNQAEALIEFTLKKTKLFERIQEQLNERQLKVVRRMLEEGPKGFKGGMSAKKYIAITGTTKATATRDVQYLVEKDIFVSSGAGPNTRYHVVL